MASGRPEGNGNPRIPAVAMAGHVLRVDGFNPLRLLRLIDNRPPDQTAAVDDSMSPPLRRRESQPPAYGILGEVHCPAVSRFSPSPGNIPNVKYEFLDHYQPVMMVANEEGT